LRANYQRTPGFTSHAGQPSGLLNGFLQYHAAMGGIEELVIDSSDDMVLVEQVGNPFGKADDGYKGIVEGTDTAFFIGQEFKRKCIGFFKAQVCQEAVSADAYDLQVELSELGELVTESTGFSGTHIGKIFGIEIKNTGLFGQVYRELKISSSRGRQAKIRSTLSDNQGHNMNDEFI
jgi:hypothetical protein